MSQAIIRGIWGDGTGHSDDSFARTVRHAKRNGDPVDKVYCFGKRNRALLERHGYKPDMLDSSSIASPRIPGKPPCRPSRAQRWGVSHWWHKFKIIQAATQEFDHVLWQDFDVHLQQPLPDHFWDELKSGALLRAPLAVQRSGHRGAWWRIPVGDHRRKRIGPEALQPALTRVVNYEQARVMPATGYFYIRGAEMGEWLMSTQDTHLGWTSQLILALMIDQMYQGWPGIQSYVENKHEVCGYYYGASINRPPAKRTIWMSGPRAVQWHARKTRQFWENP